MSVSNIVKDHNSDKGERLWISHFGIAEPHPIFDKNSERRVQ